MITLDEYLLADISHKREKYRNYLTDETHIKPITVNNYLTGIKIPKFIDFAESIINGREILDCIDIDLLEKVCKEYQVTDQNRNDHGRSIAALKYYIKFVRAMQEGGESSASIPPSDNSKAFSIQNIIGVIAKTGLLYDPQLIKRVAFSLLSKRFLILSGLAGSGKTQLAIAFAESLIADPSQIKIVAVGADWTNREPLLGFPNALTKGKYEKPETGVLDLLMEANKPENLNKPYFLILDEMNMSYVERYFADFLSAMESNREIPLWDCEMNKEDKDFVPKSVRLSDNVFIIGTINVDETTYMFSPKVLDRANVIEFKISDEEMQTFLTEMKPVDRDKVKGKAADMAEAFVDLSRKKELASSDLAKEQLGNFFKELKKVNAEFGYRTATEIYRFISQTQSLDDTEHRMTEEEILDCAIVQKLLPKLHGSRKKLNDVLRSLWKLCLVDDESKETKDFDPSVASRFPLASDKILRMHNAAEANGFASFAEA